MSKLKTTILIAILSIVLLLLAANFLFAKELEIKYPIISEEGPPPPTTTKTPLEEYVRYVFALSIRIAGFIAFGAMIYGGILYLISTGDPAKASEARKTIFGGFLGIIILLSSYIILLTINPKILSTKIEKEPTIDCRPCTFNPELKIPTIDCNQCIVVGEGDEQETVCGKTEWKETCLELLDPYRKAGVYLIGEGGVDQELVWITDSFPNFTSLENIAKDKKKAIIDLNDRVQSIRFGRNNEQVIYEQIENQEPDHYCAILFEYEDFEGAARVICENNKFGEGSGPVYDATGTNTYSGPVRDVSSIIVFQLDKSVTGRVTLYQQPGFHGESRPLSDFKAGGEPITPFFDLLSFARHVYSIDIEGNILVLLCGEDFYTSRVGACLPFSYSHPDILLTTMGACDAWFPGDLPLFAITESCVESIAAFKIKGWEMLPR